MIYIVGTEITITWILEVNASPPPESSYDITFVPATLAGTYTDDGLLSYIAPTADFPGSVTFSFLPTSAGLFKFRLTTGTGATHTVIDENTFWVFSGVPTSAASTCVRGVISYAEPATVYTGQEAVLTWYKINGICGDPSDPDVIWITGWRLGTDTKAGIASVRISTGVTTEYGDVITGVLGSDTRGIAVGPTGRVVVLKSTPVSGNNYEAYYSDAHPFTTWTQCTRDTGYSQEFGSPTDILYDDHLDVWWWLSAIKLGISADGITWYLQQGDILSDDMSPWENVSGAFLHRVPDRLSNILAIGSPAVGVGTEMFTYSLANPVDATSVPITENLINVQEDFYGPSWSGGSIITAAPHSGGEELLLVNEIGLIITTNGAAGADTDSVVDVDAQVSFAGTVIYFFWIEDFGKYMLYAASGGTGVWYESADAETWIASTDTRFTPYTQLDFYAGNSQANIFTYPDHRGVAFVNDTTGFDGDLIITR
jgi:hypothetical protein